MKTILPVYLLLAISPALAHIACYHKSMFGLNYPNQWNDTTQNYNTNAQVIPLRRNDNHTVETWFAHGFKKYPPQPGVFMDLPSGGTFTGCELACNRAFTTMRDPAKNGTKFPEYACTQQGPLHTLNLMGKPTNISRFAGTSLAIAYNSNETDVQPEDMTVISVNWTSVWWRQTNYEIPKGLPKCPPGGCICTWNWIHYGGTGIGYGEEIYNVMYRCNVTGETSEANAVGKGQVPVLCEGKNSSCITGPKVPMYAYQVDGDNIGNFTNIPAAPPTYNWRYGFQDGAQQDAIVQAGSSNAQPTKSVDGTGSIVDAAGRMEASLAIVLVGFVSALWVSF